MININAKQSKVSVTLKSEKKTQGSREENSQHREAVHFRTCNLESDRMDDDSQLQLYSLAAISTLREPALESLTP